MRDFRNSKCDLLDQFCSPIIVADIADSISVYQRAMISGLLLFRRVLDEAPFEGFGVEAKFPEVGVVRAGEGEDA